VSDTAKNETKATAQINADRPRSKLEQDELGYSDFAEAIAASLAGRTDDDGFVMAIHGKWGSGKTSAVNMMVDALERREAHLDEERRTIVVRFNPWWFSEQKNLTRAFFGEITVAIGKRMSTAVRDGLRTMAKKVSGATELVSSILAWTPAAPIAKQVAELLKGAGEDIENESSLEEVRENLAKALREEARRILVIIDDVDRLPADEARQIFRLVKSVADLPHITYLLVFDRDIAARALERPSEPEGPEWLEKIVQASFDLPPVAQIDLNRLFTNRLGAILGNAPITDVVRWGNVFHGAIAPWLRTARDVSRLTNAIAVAWPAVRDEVDVADFIAIETMRLFEPTLYAFVRNHPDDLTGSEHHNSGNRRATFGKELLSKVDESGRAKAERALRYIFPRLDAVFGNTWHDGDAYRVERERRVSSKQRFPVYFKLSLGDGIVSTSEIEILRGTFDNPFKTRELVQAYAKQTRRTGGTRASVLLNALMVHAEEVPASEAERTVRALLHAADLFLNPIDGNRTAEGLPIMWSISYAIEPTLIKLEPDAITRLLAEAADGPSPKVARFMISSMSADHGRVDETKAKPEDQRRLPLEAVITLEQRMAERIGRDIASGALVGQHEITSLIFAWARSVGDAVVREWTDANLHDSAFALWIMETFTNQGTVHSFGDLVESRHFSVSRDIIAPLVDVDRLVMIATQTLAAGQDRRDAAAHFLMGLQTRF
jgi:predicted KAP-like P-loop ATPase